MTASGIQFGDCSIKHKAASQSAKAYLEEINLQNAYLNVMPLEETTSTFSLFLNPLGSDGPFVRLAAAPSAFATFGSADWAAFLFAILGNLRIIVSMLEII
jgi:hypothetical protein